MGDKVVKYYFKKLKCGADEVKDTCHQAWLPEFNSWDLRMCAMAQAYTCTLKVNILRNYRRFRNNKIFVCSLPGQEFPGLHCPIFQCAVQYSDDGGQ